MSVLQQKSPGIWHYRGVTISVTERGRFNFRVDPDDDRDYGGEVASMVEAQSAIDATVEAKALSDRGDVAERVVILLETHRFAGVATYRGVHAGNGDALLTLPDGRKVRYGYDLYALPADSPVKDEYIQKARLLTTLREQVKQVDEEVKGIAKKFGVNLRSSRVNNDKTQAAERTLAIIHNLRNHFVVGA